MKRPLALLFFLLLLGLNVWTARAANPPLPSTAYTRDLLRSADAAAARSKLGISGSTSNVYTGSFTGNAAGLTNYNWGSVTDYLGHVWTNVGPLWQDSNGLTPPQTLVNDPLLTSPLRFRVTDNAISTNTLTIRNLYLGWTTDARIDGYVAAGTGFYGSAIGITNVAASNVISGGTLSATVMPALSGAVTSSAGGAATALGIFSSANLSGALTDETGTGVAVFGTAPTFTTKVTTPQADYTTNSNPVTPDFTLGYQLFTTNAAFTFLPPAGVDTTKLLAQTTVVLVTNSTAAAVAVTAPANVHIQGTWFVTNVTSFTFFQYAQKFTNAYAFPLW